ncbi:MAG TPA: zinc ribbon domain-containing protein [Aggregatilineales bacterium]|nr:zinc ribbon domain-containing protein [Aggregatilineales bacterium]
MPNYDYKCQSCKNRFSLFYKTYADYDSATKTCPNCGATTLSRLITQVAIQQPTRDYGKMNSNEMLSVMQSGNSRQVGEMFNQIGGADPRLGVEYHETTQRLLKGESIEKVERDLQNSTSTPPPPMPKSD